MISLRPYQAELVDTARSRLASGVRSLVIQSVCGSGKTVLCAFMLRSAAEKQLDSWFICHRRELISQASATFAAVGLEHGIVGSGYESNVWPRVQICSVQSLRHRAKFLRKPKLIVWDEAHHQGAATWRAIFQENPQAFHIGLSASPVRTDGVGLGEFYKEMLCGPSIEDLTKQGYLSPYRVFAPSVPDLSGVRTRMGDYVKSELGSAMDKPTITGCAVAQYKKHMPGGRALVFCVSIEHSKNTAEQFVAAGIPAAHVDGETPDAERAAAINKLKSGELLVLTNVDLFGEGLSIDSLHGVVLLRPTKSVGLFVQHVGRALRIEPGKKEAIILDHAGLFQRFGFPEDLTWSLTLNGTRKASKGRDSAPPVAICPACFAAQYSGADRCAYCGHAFEIKRREIEEVEGELEELKRSEMRARKKEQGSAQSLQDLIALGKQRGYKNPVGWASYVFHGRKRK